MKTFEQLDPNLQKKAVEKRLNQLLKWAAEGFPFEGIKKKIEEAWKKADRMQTPWFIGEYIMDTCGDYLREHALADAKDALFPEPGELVIQL